MGTIPFWPRFLGLAGLVPQLAALAMAYLGPASLTSDAKMLGALYAGLIFTFLGGTWWGISATAPAAERRGSLGWVWIAAVVPSLIAFAAFAISALGALDVEPVLVMFGAGLLMALGVDARLSSLAPRWWMRLRVPLSLLLGGATLGLAFA